MRNKLLFVILSLLPTLGFSQWEQVTHPVLSGGEGSLFEKITDNIFVVRSLDGVLFFTNDQGKTWTTNKDQNLANNLFSPRKILGFQGRLFVVGGNLIYSDNGGDSWITVPNSNFGGLSLSNFYRYKSDLIARAFNNKFYTSTDNGESWEEIADKPIELYPAADESFYYSFDFFDFMPFDHPGLLVDSTITLPFTQGRRFLTATDSHIIAVRYDTDSLWKYNFYTKTATFIDYDWGFQGKFSSIFSSNGNIYVNISDFNGSKEEYRFYVSKDKGLTYQRVVNSGIQREEVINLFDVQDGVVSHSVKGVYFTDDLNESESRNSGLAIDYMPLTTMGNRLIAAQPNSNIQFSDDQGETWKAAKGFDLSDINRFSSIYNAGKYIYTVTQSLRFSYDKVYVSKDSGETWVDIFYPGNRRFQVRGVAGNDIFISIYDFTIADNVYYKSTVGGAFWDEITDDLPFLDNGTWSFFGGSPKHFIYSAGNAELGIYQYEPAIENYDFADNGFGNVELGVNAGAADKGDTVVVGIEFTQTDGNTPFIYIRKEGKWTRKMVASNSNAPWFKFNIAPEMYISGGLWFIKLSIINPLNNKIERQLFVSADKGESFHPYLSNSKPLVVVHSRFEVFNIGVTQNAIFGSFGNFGVYRRPKPFETSIDVKSTRNQIVYPNPAKDFVIIPSDNEGFELYNITGQLIRESAQKNTQRIDLRNLPSGIYLFKSKGLSPISTKIIKD
jgi:photosystem II stability/assembly factor-like uncharacterized protein